MFFLSEILSRGPIHKRHGRSPLPGAHLTQAARGSSRNKYHSFREFNQEKEKTCRDGSESAPPPLPEADACPWGEGASHPICVTGTSAAGAMDEGGSGEEVRSGPEAAWSSEEG